MTKPTVVLLISISISIILLFFRLPHHSTSTKKHSIRKQLHHRLSFDPIVNELELKAEVEEGAANHSMFQQGSLNTTERLMYLFPLLDREPMDGVVSEEELEAWNRMQAVERMRYNVGRSFKGYDKDGDNGVGLYEFLGGVDENGLGNISNENFLWWKVQFENADMDGNGSLNETEFNDLLHPEDSSNPEVQMWLHHERMREMDQNADGKLSFQEFFDETQDLFFNHPLLLKDEDSFTFESKAESKFAELDVNGDEFLTAEELNPFMNYLCPGELTYAKYYTKHLMSEADDDKDGKLTLDEMINHEGVFYNAVFDEPPSDDQYEEEEYDHNEL